MKKVLLGIVLGMFLFGTCFGLMLPEVPKERCVEIYGQITEEDTIHIVKELIDIDRTGGDIRIYINSPGGYITVGLPIAEIIPTLHNDVQILAYGSCSSLAIPILASGTKGKRAVLKNVLMFIHQVYIDEPTPIFTFLPEDESEWNEDEWWKRRKTRKMLRHMQICIDDILFEHTKITHIELSEWDNNYIFVDTIIKYSIADGLYEGEEIGTTTEEVTE